MELRERGKQIEKLGLNAFLIHAELRPGGKRVRFRKIVDHVAGAVRRDEIVCARDARQGLAARMHVGFKAKVGHQNGKLLRRNAAAKDDASVFAL